METFAIDIPIDDILCGTVTGLPQVSRRDWASIRRLRMSAATPGAKEPASAGWQDAGEVIVDSSACVRLAKGLSFYGFLVDFAVGKARAAAERGAAGLMLSNRCRINFGGSRREPAVYWIFRAMAGDLSGNLSSFRIGIQILDKCNEWAVDIACRHGLSFAAIDFGDRPDRLEMAFLAAKANEMSAGKKRPLLVVKTPHCDLNAGAGLDGVLIEQKVRVSPLSQQVPAYFLLDDGESRKIDGTFQ